VQTGLREQGTQVLGLHVGPIDTDMASELTFPKVKPAEVVRQVLSAIEAGRDEVLADDMTRRPKRACRMKRAFASTTIRTALLLQRAKPKRKDTKISGRDFAQQTASPIV
jgi:hypothetical protein